MGVGVLLCQWVWLWVWASWGRIPEVLVCFRKGVGVCSCGSVCVGVLVW